MFGYDFYPTPVEVIERMLMEVEIEGRVVLEPSAGKGDIVDYLNRVGVGQVLVCETNSDLAKIVSTKGRFVAGDFLTVAAADVSHVDCVVMNPPFSADEAHILHAWEIAPAGCMIISLCNTNTLRNGYTAKSRQLVEIVKLYGRREDWGDCFARAERRTRVDVSCIWLYKPRTGGDEFSDYFFDAEEAVSVSDEEGVIRYDFVRDTVSRYVGAIRLFDRIEPLAREINELTLPISAYGIKFGAYQTGYKSNYADSCITRDVYKKELQKAAWKLIFEKMKMNKYVTKAVEANINRFVETRTQTPFTMRNIYKMIEVIVGTHAGRMDEVLVHAFETICGFAWRENCTGGETWKTNSDYTVNRKFIVPCICNYDGVFGYDTVRISYYGGREDDIEDISKALCYLTGTNYDNMTPLRKFVENTTGIACDRQREFVPAAWGAQYEWGFFRIRGFKKGTMHFEFIDEKVCEMFNRRVAEIKGWALPQTSNTTKKQRKSGIRKY